MSASTYRRDIDGLRAIAVLSVVLYHYGIGPLDGGFVGVDIFFVISGYLITGIIQSELARGEFTLARFYERRARRIFPALFAMLLVTLLAGLFLLLPSDLARLGQAATATVLFVSNALYFRQSGYFDDASDFNALLHTWSLGVEEQFYVGLPLLLMVIHRYRPRWLLRTIVAGVLLSFAASVLVQPILAKAVFFLSPFRAWELLLGSLVAVSGAPKVRHPTATGALSGLALLALLGAVIFMRAGINFPGWIAALPVLATAVLLYIGAGESTWVTRVLSWRPLVFVGLISYSLYLWHWPLLVLVKYHMGMAPLSLAASFVLLALAVLLAVASYHWVERPFRKVGPDGLILSRRDVFLTSVVAAMALVAVGFTFARNEGFPARVPEAVAELDRARSPEIPFKSCDGVLPGENPDCRIGTPGKTAQRVALLWGDSHALAWAPGMDEMLKKTHWSGVLAPNSACGPLLGLHNPKYPGCRGYNDLVVEWIRHNRPDRVYLIAAWFGYSNTRYGYDLVDVTSGTKGNERIFGPALGRTIKQVRPYVKTIVVIGPTPGAVDALPYRLAMSRWQNSHFPEGVLLQEYRSQAASFWRSIRPYIGEVIAINPETWFCSELHCRYVEGGKFLYRDGHHLNTDGADFVAKHLAGEDVLRSSDQAAVTY